MNIQNNTLIETRRKLAEEMRQHRKKTEHICRYCQSKFEALDVKASTCPDCRRCKTCGKDIKRVPGSTGYCQKCQKQHLTLSQKKQLNNIHSNMIGDNNPAKRPGVGAKISKAISGDNHPSRNPKYREQYARHIAKYRPIGSVSKLEDKVADHLLAWSRQYRVEWYELDFAMPDKKIAIEIMGCWWHCCPLCHPEGAKYKMQKTNLRSDKAKRTYLKKQGWKVIEIWEHELKDDIKGAIEKCLMNL